MLFRFLLTKLSSCLQKVDHVINYCKRPIDGQIRRVKKIATPSLRIEFLVIYVAKYNLSHIAGQNAPIFYILFTYFGAFFDDFTRFLFS